MLKGLAFTWSWSPGGLLCFFALVLFYLLGLRHVMKLKRKNPQSDIVHPVRITAFFVGVILFALLILSPINVIGRTQLFSVHMLQVVLLTTVCAPLMLVGSPEVLLRPILSLPGINWCVRYVTKPVVASVIFNLSFLLWHAPKIFDAAQSSQTMYDMMMLCIFLASLLNWWPLIGSLAELRHMGYPLQMLYAFLDGQPVDIFAFILVYSGVPIYKHYVVPSQLNLSISADQTVAGALLMIPGLVDLAVMSPLFIKWLSQIEQKTRQGDEMRQRELDEIEEEYEEYEEAENPMERGFPGTLKA
jgi:cytochrome c oxidase assembly factor CtaG